MPKGSGVMVWVWKENKGKRVNGARVDMDGEG